MRRLSETVTTASPHPDVAETAPYHPSFTRGSFGRPFGTLRKEYVYTAYNSQQAAGNTPFTYRGRHSSFRREKPQPISECQEGASILSHSLLTHNQAFHSLSFCLAFNTLRLSSPSLCQASNPSFIYFIEKIIYVIFDIIIGWEV